MNKALVDTVILSEVLKGFDPVVLRNSSAYRGVHGRFTISAVTMMEIVRGHRRRGSAGRLQKFLDLVSGEEIVPFDEATAELAGRIAGELESLGQTIGVSDSMIAATALAHGLELITGNTAHFQRVQQIGHQLILKSWRV